MLVRRLLLIIGGFALLSGIVLAVLWLRTPAPQQQQAAQPKVAQQSVLVAARAIPARTILRADDIRWQDVAADQVPAGSVQRGQGNETEFVGAAVSKSFAAGDPLILANILKPADPGFLPAVLDPGTRAVSISVGVAEGGAGLVAPGDHVDVLLTQSFNDTDLTPGIRSVGETVLKDLRVIAIDQTIGEIPKQKGGEPRGGAAEPHIPKTVTLEVTESQAERLMVAVQLGKLELALRSLEPVSTTETAEPAPGAADNKPTWAYEVSPALRVIGKEGKGTGANGNAAAAPKAAHIIEVMRGSKVEVRCFDSKGLVVLDCGTPAESGKAGAATAAEAATAVGAGSTYVPTAKAAPPPRGQTGKK